LNKTEKRSLSKGKKLLHKKQKDAVAEQRLEKTEIWPEKELRPYPVPGAKPPAED